MAAVLKTAEVMSLRGFESLSLRQDSNTNSLILDFDSLTRRPADTLFDALSSTTTTSREVVADHEAARDRERE